MIQCMIAAPQSGSGKTVLTCALLALLRRRGLTPCAFKCGPDYIDPMFHRAVLGVPSHNLDLFLSSADTVRTLYARYAAGHGAAVVEGAMGFYDGLGGTTPTAGAWHLASTLSLPVVLAVRPKGASLTLAALVNGLRDFKENSGLAGLLLNDCAPALAETLAPALERETGLPVLGFLPPLEAARFESRHLGLCTAAEVTGLAARVGLCADALEKTLDWRRFLALCSRPAPPAPPAAPPTAPAVRVAVARDAAFCFLYDETLDALRRAGAEPVFFSPLRAAALPAGTAGLYLPGGYPELYAEALAANAPMRAAVRAAVRGGLPTVAECGGFLYLCGTLYGTDGAPHPMAGVLPGAARDAGRAVRFGYAELTAKADGLLLKRGESAPVHEFHHWDCLTPAQNGADFTARRPLSGKTYACGFSAPTLYAAFPHLYLAGRPALAARWTEAMRAYSARRAQS